MAKQLRHINILADDVPRARRFYESVFGWKFTSWGPPDFFLIDNAGIGAALHGRGEAAAPGNYGVEATMAVDDLEATRAVIEAAGGKVIGGPYPIPTVGTLIHFEDTEGNVAGAMRYDDPDPAPRPEPGAANVVRWFAINADDVGRAKAFYERVFGWSYEPWGPPGFYIVRNAGPTFNGGLQGRRELKPGVRLRLFEISIGVADAKALVKSVESHGGRTIVPPMRVEGVGTLGYFEDPEGNAIGFCQYETAAAFT